MRENHNDFVDGGNGYGISSAEMEGTNSHRSIVTTGKNHELNRLEPNDTHYSTESTSKLREDYNTPIDFSSKKSTLSPKSRNASFPYYCKSEDIMNLLPLSNQQVVFEKEANCANKYNSETLSSKEHRNQHEMLLVHERPFENISTTIQNTINPFSIERLIKKQEVALE